MTQATAGAPPSHSGGHAADLASTPQIALLLTALADLAQDGRRRRTEHGGPVSLLVALAKHGTCCGADLAASLQLDQSTVSRHLSTLEADGLVERVPSEQDRRVHTLRLTERGNEQATAELARRVRFLELAIADWPTDDIESFARLLTRFTDGMRSAETGRTQ